MTEAQRGPGGNNYLVWLFMGQIRLDYLYKYHCLVLYILSLIFKNFFFFDILTLRLVLLHSSDLKLLPWVLKLVFPLSADHLSISRGYSCHPRTVRSLFWHQLLGWHRSRCVLVQRRKIINEAIWKKKIPNREEQFEAMLITQGYGNYCKGTK